MVFSSNVFPKFVKGPPSLNNICEKLLRKILTLGHTEQCSLRGRKSWTETVRPSSCELWEMQMMYSLVFVSHANITLMC